MTILMSNTYLYDKKTYKMEQAVTGFIGAFDSREKAMEVWNDALKEYGVPEGKFQDFAPGRSFGNRFIPIDMNGKFVDSVDDAEFVIELMSKDTEMNKVWMTQME